MTTFINKHCKKGFTMIEILIAITIIGILMAVLAPKFFGKGKEAKIGVTKIELRNLKSAIQQFQLKIGQYPDSLEDLIAKPRNEKLAQKWTGQFYESDSLPEDPWGNTYIYQRTKGQKNPYELYSEGPEDDDQVGKISVWDLK